MSSNISVYTTLELSEDTLFINNFLDDLIENYFSKLHPGSAVEKGFQLPSLPELISFSYPNYFCKSNGLYCNKVTTEVKVLYDAKLQEYLEEALNHKLSRLFIEVTSQSRKLIFVSELDFARFPLVSENVLSNIVLRRSFYKLPTQCVHKILGITFGKFCSIGLDSTKQLIYRPSVDEFNSKVSDSKVENFNFIKNELAFFTDNESKYKLLKIKLAYYLTDQKGIKNFQQILNKDDFEKTQKQALLIIENLYSDIDLNLYAFKLKEQAEEEKSLKVEKPLDEFSSDKDLVQFKKPYSYKVKESAKITCVDIEYKPVNDSSSNSFGFILLVLGGFLGFILLVFVSSFKS